MAFIFMLVSSLLLFTLAFIIAIKIRRSSIRPRESMFGDQLFQCYSMSLFVAATMYFNIYNILYDGVYTIYTGRDHFFNINAYVIYRWTDMSGDISKLRRVSHLTHPNLASMVGYCCSGDKIIVGYKNEGLGIFLPHLTTSYYNLSWLNRLKICLGVAEALSYLHTQGVIHGGISPTTILVDSSFHARLVTIASFLGHLKGRPELFPPGIADKTEKSDVYMFGLLLLLVLCGKKIDYSRGYPFHLPITVYEAVNTNSLHQIIDMNIMEITHNCMDKFLEVALRCCSSEPVHRPSMDEIVQGLNRAQALQMHNY